MSSATLYRLSGVSLFIGGVLATLGVIPMFFISDDSAGTLSATVALMRVFGEMLIVVGLPGMYAKQAARAGFLGLAGFLLTLFYILMQGVVGDSINAFVAPFLASAAPSLLKGPLPLGWEIFLLVAGVFGLVGGILLGIATLRAAILSRWASIVLVAGAVLTLLGNFAPPVIGTLGIVLFLGALAWLALGVGSSREVAQPELSTHAVRA